MENQRNNVQTTEMHFFEQKPRSDFNFVHSEIQFTQEESTFLSFMRTKYAFDDDHGSSVSERGMGKRRKREKESCHFSSRKIHFPCGKFAEYFASW